MLILEMLSFVTALWYHLEVLIAELECLRDVAETVQLEREVCRLRVQRGQLLEHHAVSSFGVQLQIPWGSMLNEKVSEGHSRDVHGLGLCIVPPSHISQTAAPLRVFLVDVQCDRSHRGPRSIGLIPKSLLLQHQAPCAHVTSQAIAEARSSCRIWLHSYDLETCCQVSLAALAIVRTNIHHQLRSCCITWANSSRRQPPPFAVRTSIQHPPCSSRFAGPVAEAGEN
mmetsp:Transcript_71630/g.167726  ORF Transcript_71630/g.167726 Transcript_71630/m.167726 type:complete len:227 (-) Transcript_71630:2-682(-)